MNWHYKCCNVLRGSKYAREIELLTFARQKMRDSFYVNASLYRGRDRYTTRMSQLSVVLRDLERGVYERTMVVNEDQQESSKPSSPEL